MSAGGPTLLTVDVECWFHAHNLGIDQASWGGRDPRIDDPVDRLLRLFARRGVHATFFVLGWVAARHGDVVRRIAAGGHEIASHGYLHRRLDALTPVEFREDVERTSEALERCIGKRPVGYRAPSFTVLRSTMWALDELLRCGMRYDSSIFPIHRGRYGIGDYPERRPHLIRRPGGAIAEFPLTAVDVLGRRVPVGGGGYLRLYPLWLTRRALARSPVPAVVYVHPWELDADQPRVAPSARAEFMHRVGIRRTEARLDALIAELRPTTIESQLPAIIGGDAMPEDIDRAPVSSPSFSMR
jgi:polysaccharide deacetylase family protein (PEP-CTERM system associated)